MFRMFAALTRDMVVANSVGSCFLVVFLMLSGYIFAQSAHACMPLGIFPVKSPSIRMHICSFKASQYMLHVMALKFAHIAERL